MKNSQQETLIIFHSPELYFFPAYDELFYSPFGVREHSFPYWIYRAMHILHIPGYSHFWGEWKQKILSAKKVILFDYGYERGMEQYIRKKNPNCEVYLFLWNKIDKVHNNYRLYSEKEHIYSTDKGDCEAYHFKYNHIFYAKEYATDYVEAYKNNLLFLGADKNRGKQLLALKQLFQKSGLQCDIRVLSHSKDKKYLEEIAELRIDKAVPYAEYLEWTKQCGILLDIVQEGQKALTMRVLEAVFLSKKLITNNADVVNYSFYHPNNILVLPNDREQNILNEIRKFVDSPFVPYSPEIREQFSMEHWLKMFENSFEKVQK